MIRKTLNLEGGTLSGRKCPACPAVIQAARPLEDGKFAGPATEREGLRQHWLTVHPERPFRQRDAG